MSPEEFDYFELLPEHVTLLRSAYVSWDDCEFGAPQIDPKRPYGNSDVIGDIAELLGIEGTVDSSGERHFSAEESDRLARLHAGTRTALQVVLATGQWETGLYRAPKYYARRWERVEGEQR